MANPQVPRASRLRLAAQLAVLAAALAWLRADARAQPADPAAPIAALVARAAPSVGGQLGVVVLDIASGRVLYAHDPDVALNPASNAKLVTAAAALDLLGASYRFVTALHGRVEGERVAGPLVLRGTGDPALSSADLIALARELRAAGVQRIDGPILVDDTAFGSEHLPPAFEQQPNESAAFRAAVSAVSVDDNTLVVRVRPGPAPGAPAVVTADPPGYLEVDSALTTSDGGEPSVRLEVSALPDGREHARVTGSFPAGLRGASYRRRLANPSVAAGFALRSALATVGVALGDAAVRAGALPAGLPVLASHASDPLSALLYAVGKDSNNFRAEMTLLAIAAQDPPRAGAPVTFQRGTERVAAWLAQRGIATDGIRLRNGSGLFDANRISARQLAAVLRTAYRDPRLRDEYVAQLAVGGDDGTLRNRLRIPGAERWVRAKTGTLDDVIALSGYVLSPRPERTLAFVVLANGIRGHQADVRQLGDRIVEALVAMNAPPAEAPAAR